MVSASPSSSAAAPLSLVVTWSRWAQLELLLLGESPRLSSCTALVLRSQPYGQERHRAIISYSTGSRVTAPKPGGWQKGSPTLGKRRGAMSTPGVLDGQGSPTYPMLAESWSEARMSHGDGWTAATSLTWEQSIKILHELQWLELCLILMVLIVAEGLVRALKWICHWVGQGEHQPASQVAGRQCSVSCASCTSNRRNRWSAFLDI